jgi:hypothetical protein
MKSKLRLEGRPYRFALSALLLAGTLSIASNAFAANGSTIPIAFASISGIGGAVQSGTSNVSSTYDSSTGLFVITIAGVKFDRLKYTVVATLSGYAGWPGGATFVNTYDDGDSGNLTGKLYVQLTDVNGNLEDVDFQFVVFQALK